MLSKEITLVNSVGLHARPATFFIQKANSYRCSVWIENNSRRANAKSLLGVLSLGVRQGDSVTLIADGMDENEAIEGLCTLILSGFAD
ncbi:MAG: HPr family phosphocarrier protein [Clostridia bacterium]|nr:HPr family phosphocarrier protein [Clostridia bacterium]MBQ2324910.1 HPr family phosphocarrier protein [Clostridia bacterium]MBR6777583.1 HPr family phosphocarrier protein [Clostridia bacterium]